MQLWVPATESSGDFMTAGKFLSIYERVASMIDVDPTAEARIEYGDENFFPTNYHVGSITEEIDELRVELRPPQTTCKARDRSHRRSELLLLKQTRSGALDLVSR